MREISQHASASASVLRGLMSPAPTIGIVLGSGLGGLVEFIEAPISVDFASLPGFPTTTAIGHRGRFVLGQIEGVSVIVQQGRFHAYEGHSAEMLGLPVRTMHALGVQTLLLTNAAGALNNDYRVGDLMLLRDHINLMFVNPLHGPNDDAVGPRFVDMCDPYDNDLRQCVLSDTTSLRGRLHTGVYVAVMGPNYETKSEYTMLRRLGADAVGMSTVPETLAARHLGLRVLGLSVIANCPSEVELVPTTGELVLQAVSAVERDVREVLLTAIRRA